MASVTFPASLGGNGNTYTDDSDPNTGLDNGGHRARFVPTLQQVVAMARTAKNASSILENGVSGIYLTYAAANSDIGNIAADAFVGILEDENEDAGNPPRTVRQKSGGSLVTVYTFPIIGPGLDETPTGQDLQDGLVSGSGKGFFGKQVDLPGSTATNCYLLLREVGEAEGAIVGFVRTGRDGENDNTNVGAVYFSLTPATSGGVQELLLYQDVIATEGHLPVPVRPVTLTYNGSDYHAIEWNASGVVGAAARRPRTLTIYANSGGADGPDFIGEEAANVSGVTLALPTPSRFLFSGRPGDAAQDNGIVANVGQSLGQRTDLSQGSDTQSGDGSTTTFTIAHGLGNTPTSVNVTPESSEAAATFYVSGYDSTNITLEYSAAPANATDNLSWSFQAYREA